MDSLLNWVKMNIFLNPEWMQLLMGKSMRRNRPAMGTAGLLLVAVNGCLEVTEALVDRGQQAGIVFCHAEYRDAEHAAKDKGRDGQHHDQVHAARLAAFADARFPEIGLVFFGLLPEPDLQGIKGLVVR